MHPTIFHIGPVPIQSYGLMLAIGFYICVELCKRDGRKVGIDPERISELALGCLLVGVAGTRLLHMAMFPAEYSWSDPLGWIAVWRGGLVFQGAPPAMLAYLIWATRRYGISFHQLMDIGVSYLVLAHAFGRIGCFLAGCCYGTRTSLPWGISFPKDSPVYIDHCQRHTEFFLSSPQWSYPVHPTQLYEAALLALLCAGLLWLRRLTHPKVGYVLPVYFIAYGIIRFCVEFFRGDNPIMFETLSNQQVFCIAFVFVGVAMLGYMIYRNKMDTVGNNRYAKGPRQL